MKAKRPLISECGFSMVEVLTVVLILGTLAAIALPLFLTQREGAFEAALKSDLAHAAIMMESYRVDNDLYAAEALAGFQASQDVTVSVERDGADYCLQGIHVGLLGVTWAWDSANGGQQGGGSSC